MGKVGWLSFALLAGLLSSALASVCVVSFWESWGPCKGDCNFALAVRNRDVIRPPFPERIRDGRLAIRPCPVLYQVQTCQLDGTVCPAQKEAAPAAAAAAPHSPRLPRVHKFGASDVEDETTLVDETGAAIHAQPGAIHKAPVEQEPGPIAVPSWQANSYPQPGFVANETDEAFLHLADSVQPTTTTTSTTAEPSSTAYFVANITRVASTEHYVAPTVTPSAIVPRARFSLKRREGQDEEFVPLHHGAAAIEVPGQTKRPIALFPTTEKATASPSLSTASSTIASPQAAATTPPTTEAIASNITAEAVTIPVKQNAVTKKPSKSEVAPAVIVSDATKARKDVVRKTMEIPRATRPIVTQEIVSTTVAAVSTTTPPPTTKKASTTQSIITTTKKRSSPLPSTKLPIRRLPTKAPTTQAPFSFHDSAVNLPKEILVGHVPARKTVKVERDEDDITPVAKTKITILGPPNQALGPNGRRIETPVFNENTKEALGVEEGEKLTRLPVFSKRTKARKAKTIQAATKVTKTKTKNKKKGSVRGLRWWEVINLTPKPATARPTLFPATTTTTSTSIAPTSSIPSTTVQRASATVRRTGTPVGGADVGSVIASKAAKAAALCGAGNPRCCRPPQRLGLCPSGRRPQRVVRWTRSTSDTSCVPYNYAYCGYTAEIADGLPMKWQTDCERDCFTPEEKAHSARVP